MFYSPAAEALTSTLKTLMLLINTEGRSEGFLEKGVTRGMSFSKNLHLWKSRSICVLCVPFPADEALTSTLKTLMLLTDTDDSTRF